jgi:AAHS family 4-hydroxybenzoate transporter-like MFS transporter
VPSLLASRAGEAVDVSALIDDGPFGASQKRLIAGTALLIILDGLDNQLLPNAIPAMMREWNLPRAAFADASAAAPFGMMLGSLAGGMLGDRIGRRAALLSSVLAFAALTLALAFVNGVAALAAVRFLAGMGLGGAMPNAAALASEWSPRRHRPLAVTLTIVCIPLGGFLAGLVAGQVVPTIGWRWLFVVGGVVPLVIALVSIKTLAESPRFLAGRKDRWPELRRLLARLGHDLPPDALFIEPSTQAAVTRGWVGAIFAPGLRHDTLALMAAFMSCLLAIFMGFIWIPAMLTDPRVGFSQPAASYALSLFNFGGVGGALAGALVIQRVGSRPAMIGMSAAAVASALVMAAMRLDPAAPFATMAMFAITGGLLNAVQTTMFALAAHVFPTAIRGAGVGATAAVGRCGAVLASYVGSGALSAGGPPYYFAAWAVALTVVLVALAAVRRHIPKSAA